MFHASRACPRRFAAPAGALVLATALSLPASAQKATILWLERPAVAEANNQQSYRAVLETFGYETSRVKLAAFSNPLAEPGTVLVVPGGASVRLREKQQQAIIRYLEAGGSVVADGRQEWLTKLGFRWLGQVVSVSAVTDLLFPGMPLRWQGRDPVERFTLPEGTRAFMADKESGQALAVTGQHGAGRYLWLAAPLDPHTPEGTSHYPYFPNYLSESFGARAPAGGPQLEAYFDPSFRAGAGLDDLAGAWRQWGIRAIYAAAWLESFPYGALVEACHRRGLKVYAWFAFPAATRELWEGHPEWRERTATGTDGRVGWRYSLNFQNAACFRAAMDWMSSVLQAHAWDGVNITELNYDADFTDYLRADRFVPMNEDVRRDFRRRAGFDPVRLFDAGSAYYSQRNPNALRKFLGYREEIVTDWHRRVLEELEPLRRTRRWEVIVTMLDSLHKDWVRPALGVDSRRIVKLMKRFDFTLQVEDPAHFWMDSPDRYRRFARTYLKLVPNRRRLMFDVNVMADRDISRTALPSATATGVELARSIAAAASPSGRVAVYSEHTVPAQDWVLLRAVAVR